MIVNCLPQKDDSDDLFILDRYIEALSMIYYGYDIDNLEEIVVIHTP